MLSFLRSVNITSAILNAVETLIESRFKSEYFTRNRKMPFHKLLKFLLSMFKFSTQAALNKFFEEDDITMSQQGLSKARNKFDHTPFLKIFKGVRDAFYSKEFLDNLARYDGKLIIAIDGSEIALPNIPKLREKFGGTGAKASSPTARASIAYDVMNDFVMDAAFTPLSEGERSIALDHIENVGKLVELKKALFIMDRGYPCEELICKLSKESNYLMRLKSKFNTEIDLLPLGSHTLTLYNDVDVRIVKFTLPSGEIETLITNLFDLTEERFKELYFKRWPVEVKYDIVKNKLELPNFGGVTENIIMQDFWISMYLLNMAAIAKHEADEKIAADRKDKQNKYEYQANVNTVIGSLRNRLADAVFCSDSKTKDRLLNRIFLEIRHSVVPKRPDDGSVPRYQNPRKAKFHHNKKSNL